MKRITRGIQEAIENQLPLYWAGRHDSWLCDLRVVTATYETGIERSRRLTTCDNDRDVLTMSAEIARLGGKIDMQQVNDLVRHRREEWQATLDSLLSVGSSNTFEASSC